MFPKATGGDTWGWRYLPPPGPLQASTTRTRNTGNALRARSASRVRLWYPKNLSSKALGSHHNTPAAPVLPTAWLQGIPGSGSPSQPFKRSQPKQGETHQHLGITLRSTSVACPRVAASSISWVNPHPAWRRAEKGATCCLSCQHLGTCPHLAMHSDAEQKNEQQAKTEGAELCQSLRCVQDMGGTTPGLPPGCHLASSGSSQQTHLPRGTQTSCWHLLLQPGPHYFLINVPKKLINCDISN